jgi:hypothetical protein
MRALQFDVVAQTRRPKVWQQARRLLYVELGLSRCAPPRLGFSYVQLMKGGRHFGLCKGPWLMRELVARARDLPKGSIFRTGEAQEAFADKFFSQRRGKALHRMIRRPHGRRHGIIPT